MSAQHTPGPWTATPSDPAEGVECIWISVSEPYPPPMRGFRVRDIASVHGARTEEELANAALIAAAPDLLAALKDAERALEISRPIADHYIEARAGHKAALAAVRAAIAKAEGRT